MSIERTRSVGQPLIHDSARGHVAGTAVYIDDLTPREGQLHACVGGSAITRGRVKSMNLDPLRAAPGVVDVITAADVPGKLDIGPVFPGDPLLVAGEIEFRGQPLFAVLATSHDLARRAVALAKIEYEGDGTDAGPRPGHYRCVLRTTPAPDAVGGCRGCVEKGIQAIPGRTPGGRPRAFLPRGAGLARDPGRGGRHDHYTPPHRIPQRPRNWWRRCWAFPCTRSTSSPGGWAGASAARKPTDSPWSCIAAVFARRNGCAVSCRLSRRDDMVMTGKRHNFLNHYDVCHNGEGRLEAIPVPPCGAMRQTHRICPMPLWTGRCSIATMPITSRMSWSTDCVARPTPFPPRPFADSVVPRG